eukprot:7388869-Prymnesium_polylepis.1
MRTAHHRLHEDVESGAGWRGEVGVVHLIQHVVRQPRVERERSQLCGGLNGLASFARYQCIAFDLHIGRGYPGRRPCTVDQEHTIAGADCEILHVCNNRHRERSVCGYRQKDCERNDDEHALEKLGARAGLCALSEFPIDKICNVVHVNESILVGVHLPDLGHEFGAARCRLDTRSRGPLGNIQRSHTTRILFGARLVKLGTRLITEGGSPPARLFELIDA